MGQGQSQSPAPREVPVEELSHELALHFADKCYSHLEIAHYKENFKSLADHNDDVEFWKEDTLCRFLCLPEPLRAGAGSVLHSMAVYLGAFPFPSLAPCILTREAMLKVITILTGRYKKVLKRGNRDKTKLLFRSLAVFDRRASTPITSSEKPSMKDIVDDQKPDSMLQEEAMLKEARAAAGFAVDEPANDDDEEEDDDDLALAALDSLDAIEVFKQDQKVDRKINHALVPSENLKRLVMLLLLFGGLGAQDALPAYGEGIDEAKVRALEQSASAIIAAFDPDPVNGGIRYGNFVKVINTSMPDLFEPLSALFEHFLFSKTLDLSKLRGAHSAPPSDIQKKSPIYKSPSDTAPSIFTNTVLSQLSISLPLSTPSSILTNIYASSARFNQVFSTASSGTSLSSFSRQVTSWQSATLLFISGTMADSTPVVFGAYLPSAWRDSTNSHSSPPPPDPAAPKGSMFQLLARHCLFPANPYNRSIPLSYINQKTGIALGCVIPQQSRTGTPLPPILGPVSLLIDEDISIATFQHNSDSGVGAFNIDPALAAAQTYHSATVQAKKIEFDIDSLEVWGISFPDPGSDGDDEVAKQKKRLKWEEEEAARRRGVNFGGDKDGARALLEMAGLVGDKAGNRSGGSV